MSAERPVDDNHALMIGRVLGAVMKSNNGAMVNVNVEFQDDAQGIHLDTFTVETATGTGVYEVSVKKVGATTHDDKLRDDLIKMRGQLHP